MKIIKIFAITLLLTISGFAQASAPASGKTALDRYIEAPDPSYKYELVNKVVGNGYTAYILDMTSQTWRSANEVDRTVWKHWVTIIKPDDVKANQSLLYITGGNNNSAAPRAADEQIARIAVTTKSIVTELRMVPNQPLVFADDKQSRTEDEIIAYTWDKFLRGGDENWPLRLPMTKAAVRAMDTVVSFIGKEGVKIDGFVV